jgi:hypothetical protein
MGLRQIKHLPQSPFTCKFFWMTTFCIAFYQSHVSTADLVLSPGGLHMYNSQFLGNAYHREHASWNRPERVQSCTNCARPLLATYHHVETFTENNEQ